jgi:hypothetical protein
MIGLFVVEAKDQGNDNEGWGAGAIAGIVVGAVVVMGVAHGQLRSICVTREETMDSPFLFCENDKRVLRYAKF